MLLVGFNARAIIKLIRLEDKENKCIKSQMLSSPLLFLLLFVSSCMPFRDLVI